MGETAREATVTPFYLVLDVVHNAIDFNSFLEYIKVNFKKEVIVVNGQDYVEKEQGRSSKNDSKLSNKPRHDGNAVIVRGMKTKIDQDIAKLLELVKKQIAAEQKAREGKSKSKRSRSGMSDAEARSTPLFQGKIDVLFIILNYPYLPTQLQAIINGGLDIHAFISLIPNNFDRKYCKFVPKPIEKNPKATSSSKKPPVPGSELDFTINQNCYPPARWQALREKSPPNIPFIELAVGSEPEEAFKCIEECLPRILDARHEFDSTFSERKFIDIPVVTPNVDMTLITEYLFIHNGDYVNALYLHLKEGGFKCIPPKPPLTQQEEYISLFDKEKESAGRKFAFEETKELPDPVFEAGILPVVQIQLYGLDKWKITQENMYASQAVLSFINNPENFCAYAGQKFDQLFQQSNKKYGLSLPISYFDFQQWCYSIEHPNICEPLAQALKSATIVETIFDQIAGIYWILTLAPVPRLMGGNRHKLYTPPTLNGISDWMDVIFDQPPLTERKGRGAPTLCSLLKEGADITQAFDPLSQRLGGDSPLYRLPLAINNTAEFSAPYMFDIGLFVNVVRSVINGSQKFRVNAYYKELIEITATNDEVVFQPIEDIKIIIKKDGSFGVMFYDQALSFNGTSLITKSGGEDPIIIDCDGSIILTDKDCSYILLPNGMIGRCEIAKPTEWVYIDVEGNNFIKQDGKLIKTDKKNAKTTDLSTGLSKIIRADGVEYTVMKNGNRRILFNNDLSVVHKTDSSITYEIPNLPVIVYIPNSGFQMNIDRFDIRMSHAKSSISCDDYKVNYENEAIVMSFEGGEIFSTPNRFEAKCGDSVIVADEDGTERVGQLNVEIPAKKKIEILETFWGKAIPVKETLTEPQQLALTEMFAPHFFGVRNDFTGVEFLRENMLPKGMECRQDSIPHPSRCVLQVTTMHSPQATVAPILVINNPPMSKQQRANILKNLHIPKRPPKRKTKLSPAEELEESMLEAEAAFNEYLFNSKIVSEALQSQLERAHQQYLIDIEPIVEPPEIVPPPPKPTPPPRLLKMQYGKYQPRVGEDGVCYWATHESDFGFPVDIKHEPGRPISPRCALNDPPRFFDKEERNDEFQITQIPHPRECKPIKRSISRESDSPSEQLGPTIDFGRVKVGTKAQASVEIMNTSTKPMHYVLTTIPSDYLEVMTPPGVLYPGLRTKIVVDLANNAPLGKIETGFLMKSNFATNAIRVIADIVP